MEDPQVPRRSGDLEDFVWLEESREEDRFVALPPEVVLKIFCQLDVKDLRHAAQVCQVWWSVSLDPSLWRSLFHEAKRTGRLEKAPKESIYAPDDYTSQAELNGDAELVDWKKRYKSTFHFRKGLFLGDRKKNEIIIRLDTARFIADDPSLALTGEVTLNVASSTITTHGLYILFEASNRRFAPDEESERKSALWALYSSVTDNVAWERRNNRKLTFHQGTHRFPFKIPFPRPDIAPSVTRSSQSIQYCVAYSVRGVIAYPWPFLDHWIPASSYPLVVLPSPRTRLQLMTAAQHNSFENTYSRFGGNLEFTVSLAKSGYFFGEKVRMAIQVRNGTPLDYEQVTVRPVELMRWKGQAKWNIVEPTKTELEEIKKRQNHQQQLRRRRALPSVTTTKSSPSPTTLEEQQLVNDLLQATLGGDGHHGGHEEEEEDEDEVIRPDQEWNAQAHVKRHKGEQVFGVVVRKNSTRRFVLEFAVEEAHLNPAPWCLPHTVDVEHRYSLKVKLRKPSLWAASAAAKALTNQLMFDTPQLLLLNQ